MNNFNLSTRKSNILNKKNNKVFYKHNKLKEYF